jgi:hypothetical protein
VQTDNPEFNEKVSRSKGEEKATEHMQTKHNNNEI